MQVDLSAVHDFLGCTTPQSWLSLSSQHLDELLIDHANCEKKAAASALNLMYRYVDRDDLLTKMAQLAREELLHFEQVVKIMRERGVEYRHLSPSRYAQSLRSVIRTHEPARLVDTLIIGAFIEARSCERFAALIPHVDKDLGQYYQFLLKSESRHFEDYLSLAEAYAGESIDDRIDEIRHLEAELIQSTDDQYRFHSGVPSLDASAELSHQKVLLDA